MSKAVDILNTAMEAMYNGCYDDCSGEEALLALRDEIKNAAMAEVMAEVGATGVIYYDRETGGYRTDFYDYSDDDIAAYESQVDGLLSYCGFVFPGEIA